MEATELDRSWGFDNDEVNSLAVEWRELDVQRQTIAARQRTLTSTARELRIKIASSLQDLVEDSLTALMDQYREVLGTSMGWQGTLENGPLELWANDMHQAHQKNGRPWCHIHGVSQISWRDATNRNVRGDITMMHSPSVTADDVARHCERVGFMAEYWESGLHSEVGVSLVVVGLTDPGTGTGERRT